MVTGAVVPTHRDYLMARVSAARSFAQSLIDECDGILAHCIDADDPKLKKRRGGLSDALELAGAATRALEDAEGMIDRVTPGEIEPWDSEEGEGGEEDEEDDDDEDDDED